jgi:uncharacterized membrane protein YgdD (TMEM256/DUF423 family)
MSGSRWIAISGILGALAVLIGAFAAHWFEKFPGVSSLTAEQLEESQRWLETGVRYHFYHTLAILAVGLLEASSPDPKLNVAGALFVAGILLFSGLLYVMAITHLRILGAIVPIGGLSFCAGWVLLAAAAVR